MTKIEKLAQAEALEWVLRVRASDFAIVARLKELGVEVAAMPDEEPFTWLYKWPNGHTSIRYDYLDGQYPVSTIPLYTRPQASAPADHTPAVSPSRNENSRPASVHPAAGVTDLDALEVALDDAVQSCRFNGLDTSADTLVSARQAITDLRAQLINVQKIAAGLDDLRIKQAARITDLDRRATEYAA